MRRRGRGRRFGGGGLLVVLAVGGFLLFEGARSPERVGTAAPKGARDGQQAPSATQTAEGAAGGGSDNLDLGVPVRVELADPRDGERRAFLVANVGNEEMSITPNVGGGMFRIYRVDAEHAKLSDCGEWRTGVLGIPANGFVLALSGFSLGDAPAVDRAPSSPSNGLDGTPR